MSVNHESSFGPPGMRLHRTHGVNRRTLDDNPVRPSRIKELQRLAPEPAVAEGPGVRR
jgi:hypothetical protein